MEQRQQKNNASLSSKPEINKARGSVKKIAYNPFEENIRKMKEEQALL